MTRIVTRTLAVLAAAGLVAGAAPALAKKAPKVTVSASTFKDPSSKLCMPKSVLGSAADKAMPATLCHTQEEWTAKGVTFVVK